MNHYGEIATRCGSVALLATGVAMLDGALRFVRVNAAFCELIGVGSRRLLGQPLSILHADARLATAVRRAREQTAVLRMDAIAACAVPGKDCRLDVCVSSTGSTTLLEAWPAPLRSSTGRVSETLRGFAHEVRNPLAAISGAAQLLQQGATDARERDLARLIHDETARLAALSERLLGARTTMATRAVNVHALLERLADLLTAERANVVVVRDYDPSLPAWQGDPDRLLQALVNLTRNAVEANACSIVLRSRAEAGWRDARGQPVPALRIEIEDDGDGVPNVIADSLFEPMVSGRGNGSGLGLALAREIAREHGGELTWLRRESGSCFVMSLPRRLVGASLLAIAASVAGRPAPTRPRKIEERHD